MAPLDVSQIPVCSKDSGIARDATPRGGCKGKAMEVNGLKSNSDLISFALRHGLLPFVTAVAG